MIDLVAQQCEGAVPDSCGSITGALQETYGAALQGILFYGSCSRGESMEEGVADVFVVVDSYRNAYPGRWLAWLNACLPPNVLYREIPAPGAPVRLKLALISMADFRDGIRRGFLSYLWGRFAQPARILYARTGAVRREFHELAAQSVLTLLGTTLPTLQGKTNDTETVWTNALSLSYSTEFRSEPDSKAAQLVRHNHAVYSALLDASLPALETVPAPGGRKRLPLPGHCRRRAQGAQAMAPPPPARPLPVDAEAAQGRADLQQRRGLCGLEDRPACRRGDRGHPEVAALSPAVRLGGVPETGETGSITVTGGKRVTWLGTDLSTPPHVVSGGPSPDEAGFRQRSWR